MYTGGSQFAFVGAAVLVGLRNAVYVTQVNSWFHPRGVQRILMAHITTNESTAVAAAIAAAAVTVALVPMLPAGISPPGMRGCGDVGLGAGRVAGVFRDQTGGPAGATPSRRGSLALWSFACAVALAFVRKAGVSVGWAGGRRQGKRTEAGFVVPISGLWCGAGRSRSGRSSRPVGRCRPPHRGRPPCSPSSGHRRRWPPGQP